MGAPQCIFALVNKKIINNILARAGKLPLLWYDPMQNNNVNDKRYCKGMRSRPSPNAPLLPVTTIQACAFDCAVLTLHRQILAESTAATAAAAAAPVILPVFVLGIAALATPVYIFLLYLEKSLA